MIYTSFPSIREAFGLLAVSGREEKGKTEIYQAHNGVDGNLALLSTGKFSDSRPS